MSIFKFINKTGSDATIEGINHTFTPDSIVDLVEDCNIDPRSIIGSMGGELSDKLQDVLKNGWKMCLSETEVLEVDEALHIIRFGHPGEYQSIMKYGSSKPKAFESHNLADSDTWPSPVESKFVITPEAGKKLLLTKSKVMIDPAHVAKDDMYFNVKVGDTVVSSTVYEGMQKLLLGAKRVFTSPQLGSPDERGTKALVHVIYEYENPIVLDSAYGMSLEIGLSGNTPSTVKSTVFVRIESISIPE